MVMWVGLVIVFGGALDCIQGVAGERSLAEPDSDPFAEVSPKTFSESGQAISPRWLCRVAE